MNNVKIKHDLQFRQTSYIYLSWFTRHLDLLITFGTDYS